MGLLSFLQKKDRRPPMPAAKATPARPSLVAVPGGEAKRSVTVVKDLDAIPEHKSVVTAQGDFAIKEALRQCVAALERAGGKEVLLLATEEFRASNEYLALRQRLASKYQVKESYATPAVLLSLYSGQGRFSERRDGDEALSVTVLRRVIADSIEKRASDIHIVLMESSASAVVLCRIDGVIRVVDRIPMKEAMAAVSVGYGKLAEEGSTSDGTFIANKMQTAAIPFPDKENAQYKLRWQSIPVSGGLRTVMRVLQTEHSQNAQGMSLEMQGYAPSHIRLLVTAGRRTKGLILVAGGTGSGKTTLLKTLYTTSPNREKRIQYSIENPAEYKMFGVGQIDVSGSASDDVNKLMLQAGLAVLRADPDEILIGEIREVQMASLCKTMVQSGHLVLSTLHGSSGIEIVPRMCSPEIGFPRDVLDGRNFLNLLVYQTLVGQMCELCRIPGHKATEQQFPSALKRTLREKFKLDPDAMYVTNPDGCECCAQGKSGRTVLAEVIMPDQKMRQMFREGKDGRVETYWRSTRTTHFDDADMTGKTHVEHGLYKAVMGEIDPVDLDTIEPLEEYEIYPMKGQQQ